MCLCLLSFHHFRGATKMIEVQRDTVERRVYITYSGLELKQNTSALDLSKFGKLRTQRFFYIPRDSVRIEYRDTGSMRTEYVMLPRKAYRTTMPDVDIWHSGVDSQIDSVSLLRTDRTIREAWRQKVWRHELTVSALVGYNGAFRTPIGIEYSYYPTRWIGVGVMAEYDVKTGSAGAYAGARLRFGW